MSEFDKEAEREKLRKKFAKEEEDRKSTQRMSELLLQGATMTNQHCDTCGDPIFRHKGQQFCPSCQAAGQEAQRQQAQQQHQETRQQQEAQQGQHPEQGETTANDEQAPAADADQSSTPQPVASPETRRAPPSQSGVDHGRQDQSRATMETETGGTSNQSARQRPVGLAGEFGDAEASIAETIRYFSDAAANTDDPARARECLAAVKEAAQALGALRR
ncbi:Sjogren's syndrome/scleroderma autoantigen 1 family protein [Haloarchaeobius sp. DT45]|uniref:Sjogren's syndrome/scleroderma autoantigen 1 family protein n=1 Tax=Haloarchaeobius sp. DT45 TaxID=3446116 RepID=UPI003F6D3DC6